MELQLKKKLIQNCCYIISLGHHKSETSCSSMLLFPILSLLLLLCSHVVGLKFRLTASVRQTALSIANIETFAKNMVLTEPLKERIERKIGKVINKLGSDALWSHVVLKVLNSPPLESHTHLAKKDCNIVDVTVSFKGGSVVHVSERSNDMYSSIDLVSHKLTQSMRKHHDKLIEKSRKTPSNPLITDMDTYVVSTSDFDDEESLVGMDKAYESVTTTLPEAQSLKVVKEKLFVMPPISVDEAMTALELIDHPFYMFRNKATNEINLVYRREAGGVGHIAPKGEEK